MNNLYVVERTQQPLPEFYKAYINWYGKISHKIVRAFAEEKFGKVSYRVRPFNRWEKIIVDVECVNNLNDMITKEEEKELEGK